MWLKVKSNIYSWLNTFYIIQLIYYTSEVHLKYNYCNIWLLIRKWGGDDEKKSPIIDINVYLVKNVFTIQIHSINYNIQLYTYLL